MKCLLVAVNAKYIHSNPAILCLKAYYDKYSQGSVEVELAEYTMNQQTDQIAADIYRREPDILCFSCYIWNISIVTELADILRKVRPEISIWAGGPEVSYCAPQFLTEHRNFDGIMCGEGEKVFAGLMKAYEVREKEEDFLAELPGICYRRGDQVVVQPQTEVMDLNELPFIYGGTEASLAGFEHRIIYYESSRGCPFFCSYCLSSIDKKLRFRGTAQVTRELQFFLDHKVAQVKFIDRTFNCRHSHAREIWQYILEHDNGITNFHFEIAADLITQEELELLSQMRPGQVQLEIGIQSTNPRTIAEIDRTMNLDRLKEVVGKIKSYGNIHQHVDLIAGLPYEDLESFRRSFQEVYALKCQQLQLGFLKVLHGSKMYENAEKYGLVYTSKPPYEVLSTNWMSYGDILELKQVEDMVEVYYNSGQFTKSIAFLETYFETAYEMYRALGEFYAERFSQGEKHTRLARYDLLLEFALQRGIEDTERLAEWMTYDVYVRENSKKRPDFSIDLKPYKEELGALYRCCKGRGKNIHIEVFRHIYEDETYVMFDYDTKEIREIERKKV